MLKRFLVANDGSTRAQRGLKAAFDLAPDLRPTPSGVYVIDETAALPPIDSGFVPADYLEDMIDSLRDAGREWLLPVLKRSARQRRSTTTDGRTGNRLPNVPQILPGLVTLAAATTAITPRSP